MTPAHISRALLVPALTAAIAAAAAPALAQSAADPKVKEAVDIATDAYVYGYSLLTTDVTRIQMSNVAKAGPLNAPLNQFANVPRYPPADYRGVSAPNADTLYSLAWIDLKEPQVFSHPDMGKRYFLFPMIDLWMTIFNSPGTRTTGQKAGNFLLTGPGWKGEVPKGMTHISSATRYMVILGRTYADGSEADYKAANALQAQYKITPLSAWGKPFTPKAPPVDANPGISMTDKPQEVILAMGTEGYFNWLAKRMCSDSPAYAADAPALAKFAKIGFEPCKPFALGKLDSGVQAALKDLPKTALERINANREASLGKLVDGWSITKGLGVYGTDYMKRAVVAAFGWPANLQEDAVYPYTLVDQNGATLNGAHKYTLTWAKGQTPPVNAFWSITMYMIDEGWWFVPNKLNKFTVSPRNHLKANADGSITLYFQKDSPGKDKESNWLPAPEGEFIPMLRMYWPKDKAPSILDSSWTPPKVQKVD
ncbi:MAG: DUF1254 domain-containing protein [Burkholderiaceae bacterium]|nr:DUF1254 domain-containing protein [Burkholderiaceae bacterium]